MAGRRLKVAGRGWKGMEGGFKEMEGEERRWKEGGGGWKEMKEWKGVGSRDWSTWKVWGTKIFMVRSNGNKM